MKKKDPLSEMINQIANLVEMVGKKGVGPAKGELPDGIDGMLDDLENQLAQFQEITLETQKELGLNLYETKKRVQKPTPDMTKEQKQALEKLGKVKHDVTLMRIALAQVLGPDAKKEEPKSESAKKKKRAAKQKKKFKRLGDDKWKPV